MAIEMNCKKKMSVWPFNWIKKSVFQTTTKTIIIESIYSKVVASHYNWPFSLELFCLVSGHHQRCPPCFTTIFAEEVSAQSTCVPCLHPMLDTLPPSSSAMQYEHNEHVRGCTTEHFQQNFNSPVWVCKSSRYIYCPLQAVTHGRHCPLGRVCQLVSWKFSSHSLPHSLPLFYYRIHRALSLMLRSRGVKRWCVWVCECVLARKINCETWTREKRGFVPHSTRPQHRYCRLGPRTAKTDRR